MLDQITPLILTFNEAPNIARTLDQLTWASKIVVIDSFSDDETLEILQRYPQVRILQREFTSFADQCNYGLKSNEMTTEWVLNLDADYVLTKELVNELHELRPEDSIEGYRTRFIYCINGKKIRSGIYPQVTTLFRRRSADFVSDGHAHRVMISGVVVPLREAILHDDRKSLRRWLQSQATYAEKEALKLRASKANSLKWPDKLRKFRVVTPLVMPFYCLVLKGGILDGWSGVYYALQRTLAELLLSLELLARTLESEETVLVPQEDLTPPLNIQRTKI